MSEETISEKQGTSPAPKKKGNKALKIVLITILVIGLLLITSIIVGGISLIHNTAYSDSNDIGPDFGGKKYFQTGDVTVREVLTRDGEEISGEFARNNIAYLFSTQPPYQSSVNEQKKLGDTLTGGYLSFDKNGLFSACRYGKVVGADGNAAYYVSFSDYNVPYIMYGNGDEITVSEDGKTITCSFILMDSSCTANADGCKYRLRRYVVATFELESK